MGLVKLELRCPKSSVVVASADPEPRWTWDDLLSELESLELLLGAAPSARPLPLKQSDCPDLPGGKEMGGSGNRPFAICISDDDVDEDSDDDDAGWDRSLMAGTRFSCNDLDSSDSEGSDDELYVKATQFNLMDKKTIDEGILFEFEFEHHLKVKNVVFRSITDAVFRAMTTTTKEIIHLQCILGDLGVEIFGPMAFYCDNWSAIHIVSNLVFHRRTKHIEIDCYFFRQHYKARTISFPYVSSSD